MNRETEFRGKDRNGHWHYGYFWKDPAGKNYIYLNNYDVDHEVIPSTVGQATGWKDQNDKKAYRGDRVEDECGTVGVIDWDDYAFCWVVRYPKVEMLAALNPSINKIINSIYDTEEQAK